MRLRLLLFASLFALSFITEPLATHGAGRTAAPTEPSAVAPPAEQPTAKSFKRAQRSLKLVTVLQRFFPKAFDTRDVDPVGTDGYAIASLCCGIGGLIMVPILGSIAGVVLGIIALNRIKESGQRGKGMAIAGIITGGIGVLFWTGYFVLLAVLL